MKEAKLYRDMRKKVKLLREILTAKKAVVGYIECAKDAQFELPPELNKQLNLMSETLDVLFKFVSDNKEAQPKRVAT